MVLLDQGGAARNAVTIIPACAALGDLVEHFWIQHECATPIWRIVPDVAAHIIFSVRQLDGGRVSRCAFVGARSIHADIDVSRRILTIGARLRPGVLALLVRMPATALTDTAVDAEDVFGRDGRRLTDRLSNVPPTEAPAVLAGFMDRCGPRSTRFMMPPDLATYHTVDALGDALTLPARTLQARMSERVGLSPKRALRIARLHRALRALARDDRHAADIAFGCGFADQSHMIREFRALLGETPTAWANRALTAASGDPR
jgi:AraC-like DNA-binding protein